MIPIVMEFFEGVEELESAGLAPDVLTIEFMLQDYIDLETHCILVAEVNEEIIGGIKGFVAPWQYNADIMTLVEGGWFIPSRNRKLYPVAAMSLRKQLKSWGKEQGATTLIMSSTAREESPRVRQFYEKSGLALFDYNYLGRL